MFESLINTFNDFDDESSEDIRYVAYKFLKMICEGIEVEYAVMTCENSYNIDWYILNQYLVENDYFYDGQTTEKGMKFLSSHPLHLFEKYGLEMFDYTDFERYFYENEVLEEKKIVLGYLSQFDDDEVLNIKKEMWDGN